MEKTAAIFHTVEIKLPPGGNKSSTPWKKQLQSSTPWKLFFRGVETSAAAIHRNQAQRRKTTSLGAVRRQSSDPCFRGPGSDKRSLFEFPLSVYPNKPKKKLLTGATFCHTTATKLRGIPPPTLKKRQDKMAKVTAPLFSFAASGKLGNALVFSRWKGIATARSYVIPSNPKSDGQKAQRSILTTVVNIWRSSNVTAEIRAAWNLLASVRSEPMSGFNLFTSNLSRLIKEDPKASIITEIENKSPDDFALITTNVDDLTAGTETGNFTISYGTSPTGMTYQKTATIVEGVLQADLSDATLPEGGTLYVAVRKDSVEGTIYDRSGIIAVDYDAAP